MRQRDLAVEILVKALDPRWPRRCGRKRPWKSVVSDVAIGTITVFRPCFRASLQMSMSIRPR